MGSAGLESGLKTRGSGRGSRTGGPNLARLLQMIESFRECSRTYTWIAVSSVWLIACSAKCPGIAFPFRVVVQLALSG